MHSIQLSEYMLIHCNDLPHYRHTTFFENLTMLCSMLCFCYATKCNTCNSIFHATLHVKTYLYIIVLVMQLLFYILHYSQCYILTHYGFMLPSESTVFIMKTLPFV